MTAEEERNMLTKLLPYKPYSQEREDEEECLSYSKSWRVALAASYRDELPVVPLAIVHLEENAGHMPGRENCVEHC